MKKDGFVFGRREDQYPWLLIRQPDLLEEHRPARVGVQ